jgi:2-polyprenyl-3-methyl-5-hydroxy-6-metoxy-1,4-benzoquinol methylase
MDRGDYTFPHRNGFALHEDLKHPTLQKHLRLCLQENESFCGRAHLDWSRQWEYPYVLANLPADGAGKRILDAGSGYRFFAPLLAKNGFEVDSCDLDASIGPKYDEIAARFDIAIEFTQQNLSRLTYPDEVFDFICCISVLEHTGEREAIVREFRRCLKPGGTLLITFDVSVNGDRDVPVAEAKELIRLLEQELSPVTPFVGSEYLDEAVLARSDTVLRTAWFRRYRPDLLPWRIISRASLQNLRRGRIGRPFFDLAVVGLALRKQS